MTQMVVVAPGLGAGYTLDELVDEVAYPISRSAVVSIAVRVGIPEDELDILLRLSPAIYAFSGELREAVALVRLRS